MSTVHESPPMAEDIPPAAVLEEETSVEDVPTPYDVSYLNKLIIKSFFFSQGNKVTQTNLIVLVTYNNINRIDPDLISEVSARAVPAMQLIVRSQNVHQEVPDLSNGTIAAITNRALSVWRRRARQIQEDVSAVRQQEEALYLQVAKTMLEYDGTYLFMPEGRPHGRMEDRSGMTDKFTSHFVYFVLMRRPAGLPEYDEVFSNIFEKTKQSISSGNDKISKYTLCEVISEHLRHHPEDAAEFTPEATALLRELYGEEKVCKWGLTV